MECDLNIVNRDATIAHLRRPSLSLISLGWQAHRNFPRPWPFYLHLRYPDLARVPSNGAWADQDAPSWKLWTPRVYRSSGWKHSLCNRLLAVSLSFFVPCSTPLSNCTMFNYNIDLSHSRTFLGWSMHCRLLSYCPFYQWVSLPTPSDSLTS